MTTIAHHISDDVLAAYAAGQLNQAFSLVVAAHVSVCAQCRASLEAQYAIAGVLLDAVEPIAPSAETKANLFALLDNSEPTPQKVQAPAQKPYPAPVAELLQQKDKKWSKLGRGIKQKILVNDAFGCARLLSIAPGRAVPDHGHHGFEMTMVLQGSYSDCHGRFGVGDVETANEDVSHQPVADEGEECICLAATNAPLRFRQWMPRLIQPLIQI